MGIIEQAVWYVESNKAGEIRLQDVAEYCGVSPFHLARLFRGSTGQTVMGYSRARRLSEAAKKLVGGEPDILNLALSVGYGSHEAFSRAFLNEFQKTPKDVRRLNTVIDLQLMEPYQMDKSLIVELQPYRIETRDAFRVTGMSGRFSFETNNKVPALWMEFVARQPELDNLAHPVAYGVCFNGDDDGNFDYMAGVETKNPEDGFQSILIPAGNYAVFTHSGHISDIRKTIYTIWNVGLTNGELEHREAPDFELYDAQFNGNTGNGDVEIWMPVN